MREAVLTFVYGDSCRFTLAFPHFFSRSVSNQKKLLRMIMADPQRNNDSILEMLGLVAEAICDADEQLHKAVKAHSDEYVSTKFRYDLSASQKKYIEARNKRLYNAVLKTKKTYDRLIEFQSILQTGI